MTVKEMSQLFNVSEETVKRSIRDTYPDKMQNGKRTVLTKDEAILIGENIRKKGYIQPTQNVQLPTQNEQVDRIDRIENMLNKLISVIATQVETTNKLLESTNQKQLEIIQDYYTIKGYASKLKVQLVYSEALKLGREAAKMSREKGIEIQKIPDANYDFVNSYHVSVLEEIFRI